MNARIATLKRALRDDPRADRAYGELIQLLFESGKRGAPGVLARGFDPDLPSGLRKSAETV